MSKMREREGRSLHCMACRMAWHSLRTNGLRSRFCDQAYGYGPVGTVCVGLAGMDGWDWAVF